MLASIKIFKNAYFGRTGFQLILSQTASFTKMLRTGGNGLRNYLEKLQLSLRQKTKVLLLQYAVLSNYFLIVIITLVTG